VAVVVVEVVTAEVAVVAAVATVVTAVVKAGEVDVEGKGYSRKEFLNMVVFLPF
jgi:hypothetical protein